MIGRRGLTVDDLDDLPEDIYYELRDGELVDRPAQLPIHQLFVMEIISALDVRDSRDHLASHSLAVLVDPRNVPFPDVVLFAVRAACRSPVPADDVILVAEVLSAQSASVDRSLKARLYARAGIQSYWIVDPHAARVTLSQFELGADGAYEPVLQTDDLVTVHQPWTVTLDLPAWTAQRDRIRRVAGRDR